MVVYPILNSSMSHALASAKQLLDCVLFQVCVEGTEEREEEGRKTKDEGLG